MKTRRILRALRVRGLVLAVNNGRLQIGPAERITPELLQRLAPHKQGLLALIEAEELPIGIGRAVGAASATFPGRGSTVESQTGDHAEWEASWGAWREHTRTWWPSSSPLERIERGCEVLAGIINHFVCERIDGDDQGVSAAEACARYCWGRLEGLCESLRQEVTV